LKTRVKTVTRFRNRVRVKKTKTVAPLMGG
jgi:hypothetical protein